MMDNRCTDLSHLQIKRESLGTAHRCVRIRGNEQDNLAHYSYSTVLSPKRPSKEPYNKFSPIDIQHKNSYDHKLGLMRLIEFP